ncbi:MAG: hypothetical protein QOK24_932 [Verrucomicrobiota bacterium]|jgi:hypothetical protein
MAIAIPLPYFFDGSAFWTFAGRAADIFGVIGFPLALVGLRIAFNETRRAKQQSELAKQASQAAQEAVEKFRQDLNLSMSVMDFARALSITDEIKRMIRSSNFLLLPDRLSEMRAILIGIHGTELGLSKKQKIIFQTAIMNSQALELTVDNIVVSNQPPQNIATLTQPICKDVDSLREILTQLKNQIGIS